MPEVVQQREAGGGQGWKEKKCREERAGGARDGREWRARCGQMREGRD